MTPIASVPVAHGKTQRKVALVPLGLSLSIFLAITFLLCALGDYIPIVRDVHLLRALYPDMDWAHPGTIGLGAVWAFLIGWYVALGFGFLYNLFARTAR